MKKNKTKTIVWNSEKPKSEFVVGSSRGFSAEGFISEDKSGRLILKVLNHNYNNKYLKNKLKYLVKEDLIGEDPLIILETGSYRNHHILTQAFGQNILVSGKTYTFDLNYGFELRNYLSDGIVICNGLIIRLPITLKYIREVYETCDGKNAKWYSKFQKI